VSDLQQAYKDVQAHYDVSDDFFSLFLDPTLTYTCAYFEQDDYNLEQAQMAKIDLVLGKLNLKPGMTVLDVGCGWGSALARAVEKYDVNVIGLTMSENQDQHVKQLFADLPGDRTKEVRLQAWQEFDGKVDRVFSIGAFEHFGFETYPEFFRKMYAALPDDGRMLLHTIVAHDVDFYRDNGITLTISDLKFILFMAKVIFPGTRLPSPEIIQARSSEAGFTIERIQKLGPHYVRTLNSWHANLVAHRDEAIEVAGQQIYDDYDKYLVGCANGFRKGIVNLMQFTLVK
jgi:cyclopropane-fatty-acyl-phospholipid synthase